MAIDGHRNRWLREVHCTSRQARRHRNRCLREVPCTTVRPNLSTAIDRAFATWKTEATPEIATWTVAKAHLATAHRTCGGVFIDWGFLRTLLLNACGGHALGESTFLDESVAMLAYEAVEHVQRAANENQMCVGGGYGIASAEPLRKLAALGNDVDGQIVIHVIAVIGRI